jgi:hypothetical protein
MQLRQARVVQAPEDSVDDELRIGVLGEQAIPLSILNFPNGFRAVRPDVILC